MKRLTKILFITLAASAFISCSSKEDKKLVGITESIANQLQQNNYEAAYNRMSDDYKVTTNLERFQTEWKNLTDNFGSCTKAAAKVVNTGATCYKTIQVKYNFTAGNLYANYMFGNGAIYPMGVTYSQSNKVARFDKKNDDTLRDLAAPYFKLGCGINGFTKENCAINYPEFMEVAKTHYSSCTMTNLMKPSSILNQQQSIENLKNGSQEPALDFSPVDNVLQWCKDNNVQMRGHTLVWHTQAPYWFFRESYENDGPLASREVMLERMDSMIKQYMTHCQEQYPGVVYCWDVVNEAVDPGDGDPESFFRCRMTNDKYKNYWYYTIGKDYPEMAFRSARKYAAPGVSLFYNDYGTTDKTKREYIYKLCKDLKDKGLIDGIGMQAYWDNRNPSLKTIADTINYYAELGLEIQLTEWSMNADTTDEKGFAQQAERYASIFRLLQKLDTDGGGKANITCVSSFGLMDNYPLYNNDKTNCRFFDKNLEPKPVFYSVKETMELFY